MIIELARSEIIREIGPSSFSSLSVSEKKRVASRILMKRGDSNSIRFAFLIDANTPSLNTFQVVDDM